MAAKFKRELQDDIYRIYVTDILKGIAGADRRYYNLVHPPKTETRSPEEIVSHIKDGLQKLSEE